VLGEEYWRGRPKTVFFMDEAAILGKFEYYFEMLEQNRKFGVSLFLCYQSIGQIRGIFGEDAPQRIMNNCNLKIFMRPESHAEAEFITKEAGAKLISETTKSEDNTGGGRQRQRSLVEVPLVSVAELEKLGNCELILIANFGRGKIVCLLLAPALFMNASWERFKRLISTRIAAAALELVEA